MESTKKEHCPKIEYKKIGFDLKLSIIDQISNGQISLNHASRLHGISRSSITYWMKKLRSFEQNSKTMSKNQELKKLKERIEELEFIKDFQQMIIADFEVSTNLDFAKKVIARNIAKRSGEKEKRPFKIKWFSRCFGISSQAYYKRISKQKIEDLEALKIKKLITPIRQKMARYGAKKLYLDLKDDFEKNDIKIGRDKFFHFLKYHNLLVRKTKLYHITTDSKHGFYKSKDLLVNLEIKHAEQVFVSDITYIKLASQHAYLALVTDVYSKKIMGYKIDTNMRVQLVKDALEMAVKTRLYKHQNLIHHSDRGIQYCCPDFADFAKSKNIILSTTQNSSPYENAVAERINGILKHEFGLNKTIPDLKTAQKMVKQAIEIYNNDRRHCSLGMKTPEFAHVNQIHKYKSYKKNKIAILVA